jgi:hypothetical protein
MNQYNSLKTTLSNLAEAKLPRFSGHKTILRILVLIEFEKGDFKYLQLVFWRPNNAMLVGYTLETKKEDLAQEVSVTANHDSTWRHDGFIFLFHVLKNSKCVEIISTEVLSIASYDINEHNDFTYILGKE